MDTLAEKVALVTGASRGIGRAVALALAQAGAHVGINYLSRADQAETLSKEITRLGRRSLLLSADVAQKDAVDQMVSRVEKHLGPIDILVNNAGVSQPRQIEEVTEDDWDRLITVNLKSCFLVTQAVLPRMRSRQWGRIIFVSSVAAQTGGVVGPHYAASKAGMHGLMHHYASRLANEGITVNAIAPALVETDMVTSNPRARPALIPVGRFGRPSEVAGAAVLLARNGYMTGQTLNVNGGWFMS